MSLDYQVLGEPGFDNALWVVVDSGQSISRLLFDCGAHCLDSLRFADIQSVDHLLLSHLHMDHISGFDSFFRCVFQREDIANVIWSPEGGAEVLHHRLQGFWWNLVDELRSTWVINEVGESNVASSSFQLHERFAVRHQEETWSHNGVIIDTPAFAVSTLVLDHNGPCLGYRIQEASRRNIQIDKLKSLGLRPGPWMKELKSDNPPKMLEIDGQKVNTENIRSELIAETPGDSLAYITDFALSEQESNRIAEWLNGCQTVVCEAQYRHADVDLAIRNSHTTTRLVGELAELAGIEKLVLFHLSSRYAPNEWHEMLEECREVFPNTSFSEHWDI